MTCLMEVTLYVPSAFRTRMWLSRQKIPLFKSLYDVRYYHLIHLKLIRHVLLSNMLRRLELCQYV